jgi:hypothetical protein
MVAPTLTFRAGRAGLMRLLVRVVTAETVVGSRRLWSACQRPHSYVVSVPTTTNREADQSETVHSMSRRAMDLGGRVVPSL